MKKQSEKEKSKQIPPTDTLTETSKNASVELTENELDKASGGAYDAFFKDHGSQTKI